MAPPQTKFEELSDEDWQDVQRLLPERHRFGRKPSTDLRRVVAAILFREETGCPWRRLPRDYPPWGTVYTYFSRWRCAGVLPRILELARRRREASTIGKDAA